MDAWRQLYESLHRTELAGLLTALPIKEPEDMGLTRTYATCDIVIQPRTGGTPIIYAQDYSHKTDHSYDFGNMPSELPKLLDVDHMRIFQSMTGFTEWLFEVGAVVDKCTCIKER